MAATMVQTRELLHEALVKVGGTPAGQRVLSWVIYTLGGLEGGAALADTQHILIHEGRRQVAREVLNELRQLDAALGTELDRAVHEIRYAVAPVLGAQEQSNG